MNEFFETLSSISVLVFVVTCMVTAGLGLSVREVMTPLHRGRVVLIALLANFVVVPAIAYGLTQTFPIERSYAIGLLLLAGAAGAPFLPKLAELARGDNAVSVSLMVLLMIASVVFMPLVLPLLIPGLSADPWPLLRPLLVTMLLPLAAGMFVRRQSPSWSARLLPVFRLVSNTSMITAVALLIGLNFQAMLSMFGSGAVAVGVGFVALSLCVGYVGGGPVLALGSGQRNVAAALLIATQNFAGDPRVAVMLIATTLAGLVVLVIAARGFARRATSMSGSGSPDPDDERVRPLAANSSLK